LTAYLGGAVPYGWQREGRRLVLHPGEQQTIALARALRAEGLSYARIGRELEAEGRRPRDGSTWQRTQIMRLVQPSPANGRSER